MIHNQYKEKYKAIESPTSLKRPYRKHKFVYPSYRNRPLSPFFKFALHQHHLTNFNPNKTNTYISFMLAYLFLIVRMTKALSRRIKETENNFPFTTTQNAHAYHFIYQQNSRAICNISHLYALTHRVNKSVITFSNVIILR